MWLTKLALTDVAPRIFISTPHPLPLTGVGLVYIYIFNFRRYQNHFISIANEAYFGTIFFKILLLSLGSKKMKEPEITLFGRKIVLPENGGGDESSDESDTGSGGVVDYDQLSEREIEKADDDERQLHAQEVIN